VQNRFLQCPLNKIIVERGAWLAQKQGQRLRLQGIIDFLKDMNADVLILQEVDINARRTHRLNIAEEIARKLQMNYAFGREFEELTQGSKASPAYHGQATLSRWRISSPRVIRFRRQSNFWRPHWFLPRVELFQERDLEDESRWLPRSTSEDASL